MVAYSFKPRFVPMIESGAKTHTLRAPGRRRHARVGDQLQLYTGMRTKQCRLIGQSTCDRFRGVYLKFSLRPSFKFFDVVETDRGVFKRIGPRRDLGDPNAFARSDGFADIDDMGRFWRDEHGVTSWEGLLIGWACPLAAKTQWIGNVLARGDEVLGVIAFDDRHGWRAFKADVGRELIGEAESAASARAIVRASVAGERS